MLRPDLSLHKGVLLRARAVAAGGWLAITGTDATGLRTPAGSQRLENLAANRADLLRRLVRSQKSRTAYDKAIQLPDTPPRPADVERSRSRHSGRKDALDARHERTSMASS